MEKTLPRPAVPGDIFILLTPASEPSAGDPEWPNTVQQSYGGEHTKPLHVSLQRFICPDPAQLTAFLDGLQAATVTLRPIPVEGMALQPLYSAFRQQMILKCRILVSDPLRNLADIILHQMQAHHLEAILPWYSELVTLLEGIERVPTEQRIILPNAMLLFVGHQILISRIVAPGQYHTLRQWQFQHTT